MSKRTLWLIIVLLIITVLLIVLAVKQNNVPVKPTTTQQKTPMVTKEPEVAFSTLSFSPALLPLSSSSGSLDVVVDSNGEKNKITAVQIVISYDPKVLSNVTVTQGNFFTNPLIFPAPKRPAGQASFAVAIPPTGSGKTGKGVVAKISFQANLPKGQSTEITFLPETKIAAEAITASVLKGTTSVKITR